MIPKFTFFIRQKNWMVQPQRLLNPQRFVGFKQVLLTRRLKRYCWAIYLCCPYRKINLKIFSNVLFHLRIFPSLLLSQPHSPFPLFLVVSKVPFNVINILIKFICTSKSDTEFFQSHYQHLYTYYYGTIIWTLYSCIKNFIK